MQDDGQWGPAWVGGPGCRATVAASLTMLADGGAGAAAQLWLETHTKLSCIALSLCPNLVCQFSALMSIQRRRRHCKHALLKAQSVGFALKGRLPGSLESAAEGMAQVAGQAGHGSHERHLPWCYSSNHIRAHSLHSKQVVILCWLLLSRKSDQLPSLLERFLASRTYNNLTPVQICSVVRLSSGSMSVTGEELC